MSKANFNGFLNVYKAAGLSSHQVVAQVRFLIHAKANKLKVGHSGTLDPMATGILPVCIGKATRLAEYITMLPKVYRAEIVFGLTTDSYDITGNVLAQRPCADLAYEEVVAALNSFRGEIMQVPPMVSALKKDGEPLYKLARRGEVVERPSRPVTIYQLDIVSSQFVGDYPKLTVDVKCSKGTYIRSLAFDLGEKLGVGACLSALERRAVGDFNLENAVNLADFQQEPGQLCAADSDAPAIAAQIIPMNVGVSHLPLVVVDDVCKLPLLHGNDVFVTGDYQAELPCCRIETADGILLGIGSLMRANYSWKIVISKVLQD